MMRILSDGFVLKNFELGHGTHGTHMAGAAALLSLVLLKSVILKI